MNGQVNVDTVYAFVVRDPRDDTEGIPAFLSKGGTPMPMIGADKERIESLRPIAQEIADASGVALTLCHFTTREDVETIEPNKESNEPRGFTEIG
jgi:hypothetical protein